MSFQRILLLTATCAFAFGSGLVARALFAAPDQSQGVALLSASVRFDGTLVRGSGAVSVTHAAPGDGRYLVTFNRSVTDCTAVTSGGGVEPGSINFGDPYAARDLNSASTLVVQILQDGGVADRHFNLLVFCPR